MQKEIKRIFDLVDANGSGSIEFSEWVVASVNRESLIEPDKL